MPLIEVEDAVAKFWKPTPRQIDFLDIPWQGRESVAEVLYGGAAGGGKSDALVMYPIYHEWYKMPGFKGIIFRQTFPQLEESIIAKSKEYYELTGGRYNDSKHVWTWEESGATMRFSYLEQDNQAQDHDSAEYNYLAFDELTGFTWYMYSYLMHRVRTSNPNLPAIIRSSATPGNIGHSWVRSRFVEPCREGYKLIRERQVIKEKEYFSERIFIPAKLNDNPHITKNNPDYINKLAQLPEADRRAKMDGDWWALSGQVFTEFRERLVPGEPANAIHLCKPFTIPSWWPKILSVDWGYSAKTHALWGAISPDRRVFLYREYTCKKQAIAIWASDLARASQFDENLVCTVIDPSAFRDLGEPKQIWEQFYEHSGLRPKRASNDRISGRMLIHEYLRWGEKPNRYIPKEGYQEETANRILRNAGVKAHRDYLNLFKSEPLEKNLPKLQIFEGMVRDVVNTLPLAVFDEKDPEDIKAFNGDDAIDNTRYLLKEVYAYEHQAISEAIKRERFALIMQDLAVKQDWTSHYRLMEKYEADQRKKTQPLRRRGGLKTRALSNVKRQKPVLFTY